jgi:hypothetical protein
MKNPRLLERKKGAGTFRQTTCNIWQMTSLIDNDYINYRCSLGILENKEKRKKLQ